MWLVCLILWICTIMAFLFPILAVILLFMREGAFALWCILGTIFWWFIVGERGWAVVPVTLKYFWEKYVRKRYRRSFRRWLLEEE